ncbi:glycoside hydrolase family 73 protein [Hymenobacter rubripertinctus]|uniref:Mannosyl-glycoprotein endo-beta-N-acetylglucosamidase n=1 Tax=Hymenobacter rubripertinctus TaxID=2029981 RepID=A0A418QMK6_9BACT|nr:glucosaminidase domain-containing protein [Hymenobacter rubripertinctus]RIY06467.1 mannosyl-glycoprotein endo-beta-N-acetylglucosamidase [Hymenobacter rubripertinctus]
MTANEFIATYAPAAQRACHGTGLLASVNLAQAILESGWGGSGLARMANNFFGMKAGTSWRGPVVTLPTKEQLPNGKWITVQAAFRKYATAEEAFADRVALFRRLARYQRLFQLDDAATEARLLRECGYATDQRYPEKLLAIIKSYNLTRYD